MKNIMLVLILLFSVFNISFLYAAISILECEDQQGNRSFQKTCPPNSKTITEKKISTQGPRNEVANNSNLIVTLYTIPDCGSCDEVREFLQLRKIAIEEKNVKDNLELQKELTSVAGKLTVPISIIGEEVLPGYNRQNLLNALKAAGYKEEVKEDSP